MIPVTHEPSLDLLFDGFLRRAAERNGGSAPKLRDWVSLAEAWRIRGALRECRGNRTATARMLGIGRRTLYSKMEKLGILSDSPGSNGERASPAEIQFP
jgi:DNA-binding NtrC family response regulator